HHYQVPMADLLGPRRSREMAFARQVAMFLLRQETSLSLADIGKELGGRDHSTILHGCDKIAEMMAETPALARTVSDLATSIKAQRPAQCGHLALRGTWLRVAAH